MRVIGTIVTGRPPLRAIFDYLHFRFTYADDYTAFDIAAPSIMKLALMPTLIIRANTGKFCRYIAAHGMIFNISFAFRYSRYLWRA